MSQEKYTTEIEMSMKIFFESLSEKDRRRYAAIEAIKLGHGGQKYICGILGCSPDTVKKGVEELTEGLSGSHRIRQPGAGPKKKQTQ